MRGLAYLCEDRTLCKGPGFPVRGLASLFKVWPLCKWPGLACERPSVACKGKSGLSVRGPLPFEGPHKDKAHINVAVLCV